MPEPVDVLLSNTIGQTGRYQIWVIFLIFMFRCSLSFHPILVVLVSPPVGNFTCVNTSLDKCDSDCPGHTFDHSVWEWTIVHEWDLVCGKDYVPSMVQSLVISGMLVGHVAIGTIADRFGRRRPIIIGVLLFLISSIPTAFAPWLWLYIILRWISTFGLAISMMPAFSLLLEFTQSKYRIQIGIFSSLPAFISHSFLGLIGYYCRRWNHIQLIVSAPWVILLIYWCIIPESPRWLLTMGKHEQFIQTLERGAKCNKLPTENIRPQVEQFVNMYPITAQKGGSWALLFRTKRMRIKTLVGIVNWTIIYMMWFAVAQYMGQIVGNVFLNLTVAGLVQIPGNVIACILAIKMGRKKSLLVALHISAVPMFVIAIVISFGNHPDWTIPFMGCLSMMGSSMSGAICLVYSGELLPTVVRSLGLGISSTFGRSGGMVSPFLLDAKIWGNWIPPFMFGVFPVIAVICTFIFLPETKDQPLPNTVEDADKI